MEEYRVWVRVGVAGRYTLTINFKVGREPWRARTTMFFFSRSGFYFMRGVEVGSTEIIGIKSRKETTE